MNTEKKGISLSKIENRERCKAGITSCDIFPFLFGGEAI